MIKVDNISKTYELDNKDKVIGINGPGKDESENAGKADRHPSRDDL